VREQVDGVFDTAGTFKWHRVDGETQRLGQLLGVECLGPKRQRDRPIEQPSIHVVVDHAPSEVTQRALRERRLGRTEPVEHHLPPEVNDGHLDGLGVRHAVVGLQQRRHCEQRRRHRRLTCSGAPVHRLQLGLECLVEQLAAVLAKKPEELARARETLEKKLLLPRVRRARCPPH